MTIDLNRKQQNYKDSQKFYRLHTPTLNPQDWYAGNQVNSRYKDYIFEEYTDSEGYTRKKLVAQTMSLLQIKRQEKMHNIELIKG